MLTAVVGVLGVLWIMSTRFDASVLDISGRPPAAELYAPSPDFELNHVDGTTVSLSDYEGQLVVVNFWATWCPPCRAEVPALEAASRDYGEDVVILGVSSQETAPTVQSFMDEYGVTYPVVLDANGLVTQTYRVRALPMTYFVDENGTIVEVFNGPISEPVLRRKLDTYTGGN